MIAQSKSIRKIYLHSNSSSNSFNPQPNVVWNPAQWKNLSSSQQPIYSEPQQKEQIIAELQRLPPIIRSREVEKLRKDLIKVHLGQKFIIQLGDCAELFSECQEDLLLMKFKFFQDMAQRFQDSTKTDAVVIGRVCGQFAKPRSNQFDKEGLLAYRGDLINGVDESDRSPDPKRMLMGAMWQQAGLQVLRRLTTRPKIYVSHECLHLDYEASLIRINGQKSFYNSSAHFLWLGERTRALEEGHVNLASGISNAIGVKISSKIQKNDFIALVRKLNPKNCIDKLIIITRLGVGSIKAALPNLIQWKKQERLSFLWMCDPMHGNTRTIRDQKTRLMEDIRQEISQFFTILNHHNEPISGIHIEATPMDVSECIENLDEEPATGKYLSACDPRLSQFQTENLIGFISQLYNQFGKQK